MKVKNISGTTQEVFGVGVVEPDQVVDVSDEFSNPNFELVRGKKENEEKE